MPKGEVRAALVHHVLGPGCAGTGMEPLGRAAWDKWCHLALSLPAWALSLLRVKITREEKRKPVQKILQLF